MKLALIILAAINSRLRQRERDLENGLSVPAEKKEANDVMDDEEESQERQDQDNYNVDRSSNRPNSTRSVGSLVDDDDDDDDEDDDDDNGVEDGQVVTMPSGGSVSSNERLRLHIRIRQKLSQVKQFVLQTDKDSKDELEHLPTYRWMPILSGIIIPFSILLEIPGLTEHWYIVTENNKTILTKKNSPLLDAGLSISMGCALLANIAIIFRFLEKKVRTSTLVAIIALSTHDIINVVAVIIFGVIHRFSDGFTYGQSFWFTICSTIASLVTNFTLIYDFVSTPNFAVSSSGLTRRQRSLVIVVMILLCWIAFGALINSLLMDLAFIDGLYFTIVTIETVGFGDIVPHTTASRIFCAIHSTTGILNLALAVNVCNDTVVESFEHSYKKRLHALIERHREHRAHKAQVLARREALKHQLEHAGLPVYVTSDVGGGRSRIVRTKLNVNALTEQQKMAAEQEVLSGLETTGLQKLEQRSALASTLTFDLDNVLDKDIQKEFAVKLTVVCTLFFTFWLVGSAIFHATEGWSYGIAMWFCFEAFSTVGFGDYTVQTPAGRSVFIVWALMGIGTMTILISVLSEAYSTRYKKILQSTVRKASSNVKENTEGKILSSLHRLGPIKSNPTLRRHSSCPHLG